MGRPALFVAMLFCAMSSSAAVVNVEFKFTPFVGDPKQDQVETVPGKVRVFVNNVFLSEQELDKKQVPVLFDNREIAPSVWLPVANIGPIVRKGKNKVRIEFEPADPKLAYRAQLRWASVTDQSRDETMDGKQRSTNQAGEGVDDKTAKGKIALEREFSADFATDQPWHHYPPITAISADDRRALAALVKDRVEAFKPKFAGLYALLKKREGVDVARVQEAKCLDEAYAAGVRIAVPTTEQLGIALSGTPEVVIRRKDGDLYRPTDLKAFDRIKGQEAQDCAGMVLFSLYPPRLVAVRAPTGVWEIVY